MRRALATGFLSVLIAISASAPGSAATHPRMYTPTSPTDSVTYQSTISHDGHVVDPSITLPLQQRWSVPLNNPSYPIIAQGWVIVTSEGSTTSYGSRLTALDASTGTEVWGRNISGTYNWSTAAYDNGAVFVVNFDGLLRAFDAATGSKLWSVQLPYQYAFSSPPTANGGVVYIGGSGSGGTLYAVDEANGDVLWSRSVENGDDSSPALSDDAVFVSYACPQSYGFARADGAPLWHYSGPCGGGGGTTAAYYRSRVYVRDAYFNNENGLIFGSHFGQTVGAFSSTTVPAFSHDMGFFLDAGTLRGRHLSDMSTSWSFAGNGDLTTAPLVVNGWVFEGSTSGRLYARRAKTGHGVWHADVGAEIPGGYNIESHTGLGAGDGLVIVPAVDRLVAYASA